MVADLRHHSSTSTTAVEQWLCKAARRATETTDPDAVSSELLTIYACAATAGGYGVITTVKGPTPPRDQIPSSMREFLVWVDDLYERLIDAFAAAQASGG